VRQNLIRREGGEKDKHINGETKNGEKRGDKASVVWGGERGPRLKILPDIWSSELETSKDMKERGRNRWRCGSEALRGGGEITKRGKLFDLKIRGKETHIWRESGR